LAAFGPNGHLRHFRGRIQRVTAADGANPELQVLEHGDTLRLLFSNTGSNDCLITLQPNLYSSTPPSQHALPAGASLTLDWPLAASQHWYDLSLTSSHDPRYLRRLAGHVETGLPSASDPAIGKP
jgi:phospholipase C